MQRQTGEAGCALPIRPSKAEVLCSDPPDCRCIACMEIIDRAPDVRRCCAVIHEESICSTTTRHEVRSSTTIQNIGTTTDRNGIVAAASMDEPVGRRRCNV